MATESHLPESADRIVRRAFAPWHKRTLGLAVGLTAALFMMLITTVHVVFKPPTAPNLELFDQFFYGYDVTWAGVFVGAWWSFIAGFVAGWFTAFLVNFFLATWLLVVKVKADLSQTSDFLDHI